MRSWRSIKRNPISKILRSRRSRRSTWYLNPSRTVRGTEIKTVPFHITKHFFNPHAASISPQSHLSVGQIGCQSPRLFLSDFPVNQQVDQIDMLFCQPAFAQPDTAPCFFNPAAKVVPIGLMRQTNVRRGLLPQNRLPTPLIQLLKHRHRAKFSVSHQQNSHAFRQKTINVRQQGQLDFSRAMPTSIGYPTPGN